jgi:hypothetical protein
MSGNLGGRITRLEDVMNPPGVCQRCHGYPLRVVLISEDTDEVISESYPEGGCLDCGRPIVREIRIVGGDGMEMP